MNSQTFEMYPQATSYDGHSTGIIMGTSFLYHWLSAIILFTIVILYPERPAWGDEVHLQIGSESIQGYANQVVLENVVIAAMDEGNLTLCINNEKHTHTTFNMSTSIPFENAVAGTERPSYHANGLPRSPDRRHLKMDQIRIYY